MSSEMVKMNFGDSAGNRPPVELKCKKSNHVFDGAGENVQYYSDSESLGSRKSKRYINPAICIEPVEATQSVTSLLTDASGADELTPHPHNSYHSNSTPLLSGRESVASSTSRKRVSCRLSGIATICNGDTEETPRNDLTYRDITYRDGVYRDGSDTFRLSVASLSTTATAKEERERNERKKQEAFQQWLARKEQEKREKARLQKQKQKPAQMLPTPEQREESYQRWLERKRSQHEHRKADEIMRRYRTHERLEVERNSRMRDKEEKLAEWVRKKEEQIKSMKTREERRAARAALEEERRRQQGEQAYRDWLRSSKNKPLPVPLNQGELSMRGSVSQMYVNPIPWQSPSS